MSTIRILLITALLSVIAACGASTGQLVEHLDQTTGVTVTYSAAPLVFYHDNSSRAAFAREFVNLGPIEVNRMGSMRYFVWLGIWSTVQDTTMSEELDGFENVIVFADGEPFQLTASGWTPDAIGTSSTIYTMPTAQTANVYYEVTMDQLRFFAAARDLRLQSTGAYPRSYEPWETGRSGRESLNAFVSHASL